ncbi:MAG: cadherin-like beta sandwich domain-containing protein, partial [Chitinophagaceae bacterium]
VNGVATSLTGTAINTAANTETLRIGVHSFQSSPKYFTGSIDEVRIWNIDRQESEIKNNMFGIISPTLNNLVQYYNFDYGIAGGTNTGLITLTGQSNNNNNGSIVNMALTGSTSNWVESYAMTIPIAKNESNKSTTSFTANWVPPSIATLQSVNSYLLDVSTSANFSSFISGYEAASINSTSQNITGLTPNTTYYYRVRANKTSVSNQGGFSETVTVSPLSSDANLTDLILSQGTLSPLFASNTTAYTITYLNNVSQITITPTKSNANASIQVRINAGNYTTINSGIASGNLALNVGNNTINVLVTAEDLSTKLYTIIVTREVNTWTGASSVTYNTAANWTGNTVPTINDDVVIPNVSGASNRFPQVNGNNNTLWESFARSITINSGATLSITNNSDFSRYGRLVLSGNIVNNGTLSVTSFNSNGGTVEYRGTSQQTINANTFSGNSVYNLIINNASGVVLNGALTVNGTLTPTTGTFTTNNNLTLSSIAARTASVAAGSGIINGNVTVQRFIPARRAFRFLAHPFSNNLSMSSLTDDIDITGAVGSPLTTTIANLPSAFGYDNSTIVSNLTQGWTPLIATSSLNPLSGYRVLIRGTKGQGLNAQTYTPSAVTIDWSGTLNQGNQIVTLPYNGVNKDYSLIGNPYASPINLSLVTIGNNVNANFSVWNSTAGTRGAYVTQPFSNTVSNQQS